MKTTKRRTFLKQSLAASTVAMAAGAGLLSPKAVLAMWPKSAFAARNMTDALSGLMGTDATTNSDQIEIKAPDIAENGAVVPITVSSSLSGVESISIVVANNPLPLNSNFVLSEGTEAFVSTRVKMAETSEVVAVVKANGTLYSSSREVKVTIGGCGG